MKYIVFRISQNGFERDVPIIFPNQLVHAIVAVSMMDCLKQHFEKFVIRPVSAGTVNVPIAECSGESETLNLNSRHNDDNLIAMYDYFHGIVE